MAGNKERYTVQFENGTLRSVTAQSHAGAKRTFIATYAPPAGSRIRVWPQSDPSDKRNMRISSKKRAATRSRLDDVDC